MPGGLAGGPLLLHSAPDNKGEAVDERRPCCHQREQQQPTHGGGKGYGLEPLCSGFGSAGAGPRSACLCSNSPSSISSEPSACCRSGNISPSRSCSAAMGRLVVVLTSALTNAS